MNKRQQAGGGRQGESSERGTRRSCLRILVYGAGAVGCTFGGFLSKSHQVTLLGRKKNIEAISKKGLRLSGIWGVHYFERFARLVTEIHEIEDEIYDVVLLCVKAYDTRKAAETLKKFISSKTVIVSLQNGLGNVETLHEFFPKTQVLAGRVIFGAKIPSPGDVEITVMAEPVAVGETCGKGITPRVKFLAEVFNQAGVPSEPCADVQSRIWAKVNYNCALNPLASLLECHYGKLTEKQETRNVMNCVIEEIYALSKKMKVRLKPASASAYQKLFYSKLVARTYNHHPSMLQDLQAGKRTEIEALSGKIQLLGKKYNVPVPVNSLLAEMVREKEKEKLT